MATKTLQAVLESVTDNKLTRTEAIDMVLHAMRESVGQEIEKASEERAALPKLMADNNILTLFIGAPFTLNEYKGKTTIELSIEVPIGKLPGWVRERIADDKEIDDKLCILREKRRKLDGSRAEARMSALRAMLEQTEDGRAFLESLADITSRVSVKMLVGKK